MSEIEFLITPRDSTEVAALREALKVFQAESGIQVRLHQVPPIVARNELTRFALQQTGPDIAQVGSTWLRDLVEMNALRPFSPEELASLGDPEDFVPACWENIRFSGTNRVWAVPWLSDVSILYYRRDLLAAAGVDERGAFATPQAIEVTLERLRSSGIEIPWVVPTLRSWTSVHNAAAWVWGAGGDFVSSDGMRVLFLQPQFRAGLKAYFSLGRFLAPIARYLPDSDSDTLFRSGRAAVTLSGPWLLGMEPEALAQVGVTTPPGVPFVGGSHLVIWRSSQQAEAALECVRYLTGRAYQSSYGPVGLLPVRLDALQAFTVAGRSLGKYLYQNLMQGRSFPSTRMWGLVEHHLNNLLAEIWGEALNYPNPELDRIIDGYLHPAAHRIELIIGR